MNKNIIGNNTPIADQTDWQKVLNMKDKDIDFTDNPETCAEDWAGAVMKVGDNIIGHTPTTDKEWVRIPFDSEILRAFQAMETDWQTCMNNALKDWLHTHQAV